MTRPMMRVAVLTGAGSGIGRAAAAGLARAGYGVALLGRTAATLADTAGLLGPAPHLVLPTDVTRADAVEAAFAEVIDAWGRVDVLLNNAGRFGASRSVDELDPEDWRKTIEVNLSGMFLCARAAFAAMRGQHPPGGRIVNNGSISAQVPRPWSAAYAASKHGVAGLTKAIALDGRPYDVRCTQLDIGNAHSDMTRSMSGGVLQADGSVLAEPTFDVTHAADLIVYLAGLPLDVDVPAVTMTAAGMPFRGRG